VEGLELNQRLTEAQQKIREITQAVDKVLEFVADQDGEAVDSLEAAGEALKTMLDEEVDLGAANQQRRGIFGLQSTWEAPSEAERIALDRMSGAVAAVEAAVDQLVAGAVADFRSQAEAAGVSLFPDIQPLGG